MAEPISLGTAALWAGIAQAGAQGIQAGATAGRNRKQRKWQTDQYWLERQHMMEDFHRTNAYNSPAAQMQRFKEAGLSPHLIYGQGTSGNASVTSTPNMGNPDIQIPDFAGIGNVAGTTLSNYIQAQQTDQSLENAKANQKLTEAQTTNSMMDALVKRWELTKDQTWGERKRSADLLIAEADAIIRSELFEMELESKATEYLKTGNTNLMENWEAVMKNQVYSEEANRDLYKLMVRSGFSQSVAQAALTQLELEMKQMDVKYYMPNMVMGAIQKVVGMISPIKGLFGNSKIHEATSTGSDGSKVTVKKWRK